MLAFFKTGNMPTTNMQRVPKRTFLEMSPEVKQVGNLIDLPHTQDNHRHYKRYQKERLFVGSSVKSESKDCQTYTEHDNQNNIVNKPFVSVPNYNLLDFGRASSQFDPNAAPDVVKNGKPVNQLAYNSQGGSTLMENPKGFGSKTFKPSRSQSSYEAPKSSAAGSSKIFAVQAPERAYGHVVFKPPVSRDVLLEGPNPVRSISISSHSKQHGASQTTPNFKKFQAASSTYGPILMGAPVNSRTNPGKPSYGGFRHAEAKPLVVSSRPIFILQGSESTQAPGSTLPKSVKPLGVPSMIDVNQYLTPQSSLTSNVGGQHGKLWNEPLYSSMRRGQNSDGPKPPKQPGSDCRVVGQYVASSGEIHLAAPKSHQFQKTSNTRGPSQTGYPVYSVSGRTPMHLTQNGAQHNVVKSSVASSGEIRMMSVPTNVQIKTQTSKFLVTSKPSASSPEHRVQFPSSQTALQYQPFEARQNSSNVQPTTGTYASPPQSGYKVFSSFRGTSHKPGSAPLNALTESRFSVTKPSIDDSNEINAVRARLNKWPQSNFGNLQNQWASGNNAGALTANSGALQSVLSSSNLGQWQGQNVQIPVTSLVTLDHGSKKDQGQSAEIQDSSHAMFGRGVIRRLPTISSSYRPGLIPNVTQLHIFVSFNQKYLLFFLMVTDSQNQAQGVDSSAPGCAVTQNHPSGVKYTL